MKESNTIFFKCWLMRSKEKSERNGFLLMPAEEERGEKEEKT